MKRILLGEVSKGNGEKKWNTRCCISIKTKRTNLMLIQLKNLVFPTAVFLWPSAVAIEHNHCSMGIVNWKTMHRPLEAVDSAFMADMKHEQHVSWHREFIGGFTMLMRHFMLDMTHLSFHWNETIIIRWNEWFHRLISMDRPWWPIWNVSNNNVSSTDGQCIEWWIRYIKSSVGFIIWLMNRSIVIDQTINGSNVNCFHRICSLIRWANDLISLASGAQENNKYWRQISFVW